MARHLGKKGRGDEIKKTELVEKIIVAFSLRFFPSDLDICPKQKPRKC